MHAHLHPLLIRTRYLVRRNWISPQPSKFRMDKLGVSEICCRTSRYEMPSKGQVSETERADDQAEKAKYQKHHEGTGDIGPGTTPSIPKIHRQPQKSPSVKQEQPRAPNRRKITVIQGFQDDQNQPVYYPKSSFKWNHRVDRSQPQYKRREWNLDRPEEEPAHIFLKSSAMSSASMTKNGSNPVIAVVPLFPPCLYLTTTWMGLISPLLGYERVSCGTR